MKRDGLYSADLAFQLDSPSCGQLREFFSQYRGEIQNCPVFTIYFSGHGGIHNGRYYLCPKDYSPDFPSSCGISISELIRYAQDLGIKVLNIVIDACQSGHSSADLREAIERPARENEGSMCISILASSLPDQSSITGEKLSAFTSKLNDFISGASDSQVIRPLLTLSDISSLFPEIRHKSGKRQNIVHYSLNVLGPAYFCINPLIKEKRVQPHNSLLSPASSLGATAFKLKQSLEAVYTELPNSFKQNDLLSSIRAICNSSSGDLIALDELLWHYVDWFTSRAAQADDWSLPLRISAAISTASMEVGWKSDLFMRSQALSIARSLERDISIFEKVVNSRNLAHLALFTSLDVNSFYFSPIRLSHCYARIGLCMFAARLGLLDSERTFNLLADLVTLIQGDAINLHVILNESQGPHLGIFFAACASTQNSQSAEQTFGLYLCDHFMVKGKVLRDGCNTEMALKYMQQRAINPEEINYGGIALPNTVLPIFMICAEMLDIGDCIDPYLARWNNMATSFFVAESNTIFGREIMDQGVNVTRSVGRDFYVIREYCEELRLEHVEGFEKTSPLSERGLISWAAAYIYPDRFPSIFAQDDGRLGRDPEIPNAYAL